MMDHDRPSLSLCPWRMTVCKPRGKNWPRKILGEQGWRSGESARLPPMCPRIDSRRHMWVEFVVGSRPCSEDFSSGSPGFLPPQTPTFLNSNSVRDSRATGLLVEHCCVSPSLDKVDFRGEKHAYARSQFLSRGFLSRHAKRTERKRDHWQSTSCCPFCAFGVRDAPLKCCRNNA